MPWKNYPAEFKCDKCDGDGESYCSCCGNEGDCGACDGEGMVGVDLERLRAEIIATRNVRDGVWELIEDEVWVGRTDGVNKWYYRDFKISEQAVHAGA